MILEHPKKSQKIPKNPKESQKNVENPSKDLKESAKFLILKLNRVNFPSQISEFNFKFSTVCNYEIGDRRKLECCRVAAVFMFVFNGWLTCRFPSLRSQRSLPSCHSLQSNQLLIKPQINCKTALGILTNSIFFLKFCHHFELLDIIN